MIRIDRMASYFSDTKLVKACVSKVTSIVEASKRGLSWMKARVEKFIGSVATRSQAKLGRQMLF